MKRLSLLLIIVTLLTFMPRVACSADRRVIINNTGIENSVLASTKTHYFALIIGNNDYRYMPKLKTPIEDAREVEAILKERYGFTTKLLINATRKDILSTINDFRKQLGESDNLLIYYAGHGQFDKTANKAYWLPVDAQIDDSVDWIMADDITSNIRRISSRHVLLVSDSCYSGTLTRSVNTDLARGEYGEFIKKMMERPSRTLMASGGNEPVSDGGGGKNSVFAAAFIKALSESDRSMFTAGDLYYDRIKVIVGGKSEQVPEYKQIQNSGDEGGDFVFRKSNESNSPSLSSKMESTSSSLDRHTGNSSRTNAETIAKIPDKYRTSTSYDKMKFLVQAASENGKENLVARELSRQLSEAGFLLAKGSNDSDLIVKVAILGIDQPMIDLSSGYVSYISQVHILVTSTRTNDGSIQSSDKIAGKGSASEMEKAGDAALLDAIHTVIESFRALAER